LLISYIVLTVCLCTADPLTFGGTVEGTVHAGHAIVKVREPHGRCYHS
jgi:hypothetical protein